MIAQNQGSFGSSRPSPIQQWEDDGGAIPGTAGTRSCCQVNVGQTERLVSALAGGAMLFNGLTGRSITGLVSAALGGGLLYRAITGHCYLYETLGMSTAESASNTGSSQCVTAGEPADQESSRLSGQDSRWSQPGASLSGSSSAAPTRAPDRTTSGAPGTPPPGRT